MRPIKNTKTTATSFVYDPIIMKKSFELIGKESKLKNKVAFLHIDTNLKKHVYSLLGNIENYTLSDLLNDCLLDYIAYCKMNNIKKDDSIKTFRELIDVQLKKFAYGKGEI